MQGNPDKIKVNLKVDFKFNGTDTKNIRLKWLAVCMNFDFTSGAIDLFLNGKKLDGRQRQNATLPKDAENLPMIVRIGKFYADETPLIGKIVDINMWDR